MTTEYLTPGSEPWPDDMVEKLAIRLAEQDESLRVATETGAMALPLAYYRARRLLAEFWPLAYRSGQEDAAKAIDDARAYPYIDVEKAKALARGQQLQPEPWEVRAAATGGGPCPTCRKPFWTHVCLSCSPDYQTPGKGCHNCRNTGMDQTPCKPPRGEHNTERGSE